ncbi:MAG: HAMP domain-containing histidine kinase [Bacteroidetes bacterium]|nr:HAMP domain-containing histidine kinase [Bacteroidota bacterium]
MNIYTKKRRWKLILFLVALFIVVASLWYTNVMVNKISREERINIEIWANAIQRKADLVSYTEKFFQQIQTEERKRAEILADAFANIKYAEDSKFLDFYLKIITYNTTIPVILTDKYDSITNARNVDEINFDGIFKLQGDLKRDFSQYEPILLNYYGDEYVKLYFKESKIFTELRQVLDDLIESFFSEVVRNAASVPVIITDSSKTNVLEYGNIDPKQILDTAFLRSTILSMEAENPPIEISLAGQGVKYIFYKDSPLLIRLRYYPYLQFGVIGLFLIFAYLMFDTARRSEQNQVWVGMSRETAHQLGTPLSSVIAWMELLDIKGVKDENLDEIRKDIERLQNVTERFSKIGSTPKLEPTNLVGVIYDSINYIRSRTSSKVHFTINLSPDNEMIVPLNSNLFGWVIENLCKNAVDAMSGSGTISIDFLQDEKFVHIDISDTGRGIPKSLHKTIFNPGYTSKKRGWGLGLSLSKRIIHNYHKGKIFVKSSNINRSALSEKGTTFRISLRKRV